MKIARSIWETDSNGLLDRERVLPSQSFSGIQGLFSFPWISYEIRQPRYIGFYIDREGHYGAGDRSLRLILGTLRENTKLLNMKYSIAVMGYLSTSCRQLDLPTFYDMNLDRGNRWLDG
ncbi:MAG: hypothetical protein ACW99G_19090 [Candidatus Thorarchaeota archaeon]|jgi:hypothetical protein